MSARGRSVAAQTGHLPHADDFYATPAWCTRAVLPVLATPRGSVLEPAAGEGAIAVELLGLGVLPSQIDLVEVDRDRALRCVASLAELTPPGLTGATMHQANYLEWARAARDDGAGYDLIITNPPYSLALEYAELSLPLLNADGELVMLTRLSWLASQRRANFLRVNTPSVHVLPRRPSFTGGGTDATDYAWLVWRGRSDTRVFIAGYPTVSILTCESAR